MRRREVIVGLASIAGLAHAQGSSATHKIGYLHPKTIDPDAPSLRILRPTWEPSEPETVPDEGILGRPLSAAAAQVARARLLCGFRKRMGSGKLENLARYAARGDRPSGKGGRLAELGHSPLARDLGVSDRTVRRWACFS
jgi:hypothetical protein